MKYYARVLIIVVLAVIKLHHVANACSITASGPTSVHPWETITLSGGPLPPVGRAWYRNGGWYLNGQASLTFCGCAAAGTYYLLDTLSLMSNGVPNICTSNVVTITVSNDPF